MTSNSQGPRLGILLQGVGAVASTLAAGVFAARRGLAEPVGSLSQLGRFADGALIHETTPLAKLDNIVFGGWDIFGGTLFDACEVAKVLDAPLLAELKAELEQVHVMPGAFDPDYVRRLNGTHTLKGSRREWLDTLRQNIRDFIATNQLDGCVLVNCSSTEKLLPLSEEHMDIESFERAIDADSALISPAMLYAYAAILEGVPYANGTPSLAADIPVLTKLAEERGVPLAGKDFKTGQTLVKTVIAPMLRARALGLNGWFSTNILGNRDGEVLSEPENFKTKEKTKLGVLDNILEPTLDPKLYEGHAHEVRINFYRPRGDQKEGWDNIDFFGWLGYPMQMKIDLLCRDSILAAPIALDLALFLDLAKRAGQGGEQSFLSFYWKSPCVPPGEKVVHDLFKQETMLRQRLVELSAAASKSDAARSLAAE